MNELDDLLKPSWGSERWILEGWEQITHDEKEVIKGRLHELFKDGLPFEIKHNKLLYIYTFSLLAQLEVLAIQVPLKFEAKMSTPEYKTLLHTQLLDEIFHGLVFTKIVYLLCSPHAQPPAYNEHIEDLCNFIRNEECPKVAIMLLNLIGEGWIEEIFYSLHQQKVAPKVFDIIISDEHRHVCEADLYRDIGMPDINMVREKLEHLEEQLLTKLFLQYKYVYSICSLLGVHGTVNFMKALNAKHSQQLTKINLIPSEKWLFFMKMLQGVFPKIQEYSDLNYEVPMTPIRQVFMTQWDNPSDPTMVGEFNLNVSCLDFFGKKFPPETITTLMLQTISKSLSQNDTFRSFLSHKKLYQSKEAYVGIVVKLPDCGDHIGTVIFENCHTMSLPELATRIRVVLQRMVYCFKKREELESMFPHLKLIGEKILYDFANDLYGYPIPGNSVVALSNIGHCGYTRAKSPLRFNEAMKFTLLEVERKQVWNKESQLFEVQDTLPISISADHRIFDGNLPIPKLITTMFYQMYQTMIQNGKKKSPKRITPEQDPHLMKFIEQIIMNNIELAYKLLTGLQTVWPDFMALEELFDPDIAKQVAEFST